MSQNVILHKPCNQPISPSQKKAIVDEWLREFRSKGGKSRWKSLSPEEREASAIRLAEARLERKKASLMPLLECGGLLQISPYGEKMRKWRTVEWRDHVWDASKHYYRIKPDYTRANRKKKVTS